MRYISVEQASRQWGLTSRRVQQYCAAGQIDGAERLGKAWMIPEEAPRPTDARRKEASASAERAHANPAAQAFLSPRYDRPGGAPLVAGALKGEFARRLFQAQVEYYQGEVFLAARHAEECMPQCADADDQIACLRQIALCSIYTGNAYAWRNAQEFFDYIERERPGYPPVRIARAVLSTSLYVPSYPEWLKRGRFGEFDGSTHYALALCYARMFLIEKDYASLRAVAEPFVALEKREGGLAAQTHMRLYAAIAYARTGEEAIAREHIEAALDLALPDGLFLPLVENRRQLGFLMDDALRGRAPEALARAKDLSERLLPGFEKLYEATTGNILLKGLTAREYEMTRLAMQGMRNAEIAQRLGIARSSVKTYFSVLYSKLGIKSREELRAFAAL